MHNLSTVFQFEVIRALRKKSFWIVAMAFPIIVAIAFTVIMLSNKVSNEAALAAGDQQFSVVVTDKSGVIEPTLLHKLHATTITDKQRGIDDVAQGDVDAYFYYPADLSSEKVDVYAKDVGLFNNNRYKAVAQSLLQQSVADSVNTQATAILKGNVAFDSTTYKDGVVFDGFQQLIAPGAFLVLFYILIIMFGNQMLSSTTEEKENRVIEMILTTIEARALIVGKILSLVVLALVQIIVISLPIIMIYFLFRNQLSLPDVDLSHIPLDPLRIGVGAIIFALSFLLFTGLLVAIGAAVPTAKEAGGFFGVVMVFVFGPLYAASLFVSSPESLIVKILSFFPLTAPIPLMLRNAVGNLTLAEALLGIVILAISVVLVMALAIRLFRYGALEYSKRLSLRAVFRRTKSTPQR